MKISSIALLVAGFLVLLIPFSGFASDGWETNLRIGSGKAETRLSLGQRPDATALIDGLYDVPAMLSGEIQVFFRIGEDPFWRDIRNTGGYAQWHLIIQSRTGEPITISWDPAELPGEKDITLLDDARGIEMDMKVTDYYFLENISESSLLIEVKDNR